MRKGAREKLNKLHVGGDVIVAGVVGVLVQSWLAFWIALAILVGLDLHTGNVRFKKRQSDIGNRKGGGK